LICSLSGGKGSHFLFKFILVGSKKVRIQKISFLLGCMAAYFLAKIPKRPGCANRVYSVNTGPNNRLCVSCNVLSLFLQLVDGAFLLWQKFWQTFHSHWSASFSTNLTYPEARLVPVCTGDNPVIKRGSSMFWSSG
jgi:hypothetical protein